MPHSKPTRIGLISDTHGLVRPEALAFLEGSDVILHAGDVCEQHVLDVLARVAPTTAVRGNNDHGAWADGLEHEELMRIGDVLICMVHDLATLTCDPAKAGVGVVVYGHSHKPTVDRRGGVLYVNPGSAGPRRFRLPISCGELIVVGGQVSAKLFDLETRA